MARKNKLRVKYGDTCDKPGCKEMAVGVLNKHGKREKLCYDHFIGPELPIEVTLVRSTLGLAQW